MLAGHLEVNTLYLTLGVKTQKIDWGVTARPDKKAVLRKIKIYFN